jgi:two-component system NtrC family response regulator
MNPQYRLMIVDDEPRMCQVLSLAAQRWGYAVKTASNGQDALALADSFLPELVVTDLKMPVMDGEELLRRLRERDMDVPVVVMTAYGTVKSAVEAIRNGAFDYIQKPFDNEELRVTLARAVEFVKLRVDNATLRRALDDKVRTEVQIIGDSQAMRAVLGIVERVGPTKATVLITGESGTGKELVARALHYRSPRAGRAFVAVNCAALSESLLESELFGHEKGAFTGAVRTHRGKFEEADGGTIFLDEIGETTNSFQTKLLRVLQEGTFERVGGSQTLKVEVRAIAATNRNLSDLVSRGQFREDLFYRLQVVPIHLPPLRERRADVVPLARHFLEKTAREMGSPPKHLSDDAVDALIRGDWRGNVRELENTIERAVILSRGDTITAADLWMPVQEADSGMLRDADPSGAPAGHRPTSSADLQRIDPGTLRLPLSAYVEEMTKRRVLAALEESGWRKQEAADALGIDRATLYRITKKFGIEPT